MNKLPPEQLLFEVEDVLRTMPPTQTLNHDSPEVLAWLGRASAAIHAWDSMKAITFFDTHVRRLSSSMMREFTPAMRGVLVMLHQARHDLRMKTTGPLSVGVSKGNVFEYFDEVRQIVELARTDLLFVDPYLDAEFVARFLPFAANGTVVRLLGREKIPALVAAATLFSTQNQLTVSVRSSQGLHDRYVFVDSTACYQSGASFKDGAKKAGTTLTQITDAFTAVRDTYESLWANATLLP
jgi:hypothetical protein